MEFPLLLCRLNGCVLQKFDDYSYADDPHDCSGHTGSKRSSDNGFKTQRYDFIPTGRRHCSHSADHNPQTAWIGESVNKDWEINLMDLSDCSSPELDILVEMNAIIKCHAGNICFKIKEGSNIIELLKSTSLDKLFTIVQT